jgi:hypothetical protein
MVTINSRIRMRDATGRWPAEHEEKPGRARELKSVWLRTTKGGADLQPAVSPQGLYGGISARQARNQRRAKSRRITAFKHNTKRGVAGGQARNNRGRKRVIERG